MNSDLKLLFLAFAFPPVQSSSCPRTRSISKYLSRLGWNVTVVTADPSFSYYPILGDAEKADADLRDAGIKRILTGGEWSILLRNRGNGTIGSIVTRGCRKVARGFANYVGWSKSVDRALNRNRITSKDVDVILATGPPYVSFSAASRVAKRLQRPYVLDYRDPWTGNPHMQHDGHQEEALLAGAAAVSIVTPSWRSAMDDRFQVGTKLHVVTNGYDSEHLSSVYPHGFDHFAVVYAGKLYPPKRVLTPLLAALQCIEQRTDQPARSWKFHYYGPHETHVRQEAERFGVLDKTILHGNVSRAEALAATCGAGAAVIITSVAENAELDDKGIMTGKIFEALGLGTPMLLIAPNGSDSRAVVDSAPMSGSFTGSDRDGIAQFLFELMNSRHERQAGRFDSPYSWSSLAEQYDKILRGTLDAP